MHCSNECINCFYSILYVAHGDSATFMFQGKTFFAGWKKVFSQIKELGQTEKKALRCALIQLVNFFLYVHI